MRDFEMIYLDEVSSKAVLVYRYLRDRQGNNENCYVSHKRIAADNKCSVSTVKRAIKELVSKGYVTVTHRRRADGSKQSSLYKCRT
jgi:DNA-binding MarR family transcriptional regulator